MKSETLPSVTYRVRGSHKISFDSHDFLLVGSGGSVKYGFNTATSTTYSRDRKILRYLSNLLLSLGNKIAYLIAVRDAS